MSDADYKLVSPYKWYAYWRRNTWYVKRRDSNGRTVHMHRFIKGLKTGDRRQVDHRNRRGLDNRRRNLRVVTNQQNQFNRAVKGYTRRGDRCEVRIKVNWKSVYVGSWKSTRRAHAEYLKAKRKYHKL